MIILISMNENGISMVDLSAYSLRIHSCVLIDLVEMKRKLSIGMNIYSKKKALLFVSLSQM